MNKETSYIVIRYALFGIIIVSALLLLWWYFFLKQDTAAQDAADRARGLDTNIPEFSATEGNTYFNLAESLPSTPLWRSAKEAVQEAIRPLVLVEENEKRAEKLWQVSVLPIAGMGFVSQNGSTTLRFVERATGNVLEGNPETQTVSRLTNTRIANVREVLFADSRVFFRSVEDGKTVVKTGTIDSSSTSTKALVTRDLEGDIASLAINPSGKEIHYFVSHDDGTMTLTRGDEKGGGLKRVVSFGTHDWEVRYKERGRVVAVERAADGVEGYAYEVSSSGERTPIVRNVPGLTALFSASTSAFIYGMSKDSALSLFLKKTPGEEPVLLPLKTVAEKCAFAPDGKVAYCAVPRGVMGDEFLNRWYRGEIQTSDVWWEVSIESGTVRQVFDPEIEKNIAIDADIPAVSGDGTFLAFRNARDWSLWMLALR